jgi:uridylate kinase
VARAPAYRRVLLKLSGGAFAAEGGAGLDADRVSLLAREVADARAAGAQTAVVVGGGNVVRGRLAAEFGWPQASVDYMGMLATVVNALALKEGLANIGQPAVVMSAFGVGECCERYRRERAVQLLEAGSTVIFGGGTGRPFFTTDTAAALRACEVGAEVVLKATDVEGVYDRDPDDDADARRFDELAFDDVIARGLKVMDAAAAALCRDHGIPWIVFSLYKAGNLGKIIRGARIGTYVG